MFNAARRRALHYVSSEKGATRLSYSPFLKPIIAAGVRCVVVDVQLEDMDPQAFRFLLDFAKDNELKLRPGRKKKRPEEASAGAAASTRANSVQS